jgi:hypothetical protein
MFVRRVALSIFEHLSPSSIAQAVPISSIACFVETRAFFRQPSIAYAVVERVAVAVHCPGSLILLGELEEPAATKAA